MYRLSLKDVVPLAESASIVCLFVCLFVHKVYPYSLQQEMSFNSTLINIKNM